MRDLWVKIAHSSGASVFTILSSILTLAITARVLGPAGRGVYAAAISWVGLFATFGSLSLGQVIIHHVAGRPSEEWLGDVVGSALAVTAGAAVIGWCVLAALYVATGGRVFGNLPSHVLLMIFVALPFLIWSDTGRYLLTAMGAISVANWAQVLGATLGVIGITLLVLVARAGVQGAVTAYAFAAVGAALFAYRYLARHAGIVRIRRELTTRLLRGSAQLHLNAVGAYLFTQASVLVLNYYRSPEETAYYQLAMQLLGMSLIVPSAIATVSFEMVARDGPDGAWPRQRRLLLQATLGIALVAMLGYFLSPLAVRLVAGERFLPSVPLFRTVLPALLGVTFSSIMASQWIGRGLFLQAAMMTLGVGLISLACDLVLIPRYGVRGALVSTLVTYGISVVGNGVMALWVQSRVSRATMVAS
jgi:antigen flippase